MTHRKSHSSHPKKKRQHTIPSMTGPRLESMESRTLLSASIIEGQLLIEGTAGADVITIVAGAGLGEVVVNGPDIGADTLFNGVTGITINGLAGNDTITVGANIKDAANKKIAVTINGGDDDDTIAGGSGNDVIDGGAGIDTIDYSAAPKSVDVRLDQSKASRDGLGGRDTLNNFENVTGTAFNDSIRGNNDANVINGGVGNDNLRGEGGDDTINGGEGNDTISDTGGNNTIDAGEGNNRVTTGSGDDSITTGSGNDKVEDDGGSNTVNAGAGNNSIKTEAGDDTITTGAGNDSITDEGGTNIINAGDGNNRITTGEGDDTVTTGSGNDTVTTRGGNDVIDTDGGNDNIRAGDGDDDIDSGAGEDNVRGEDGDDTINGGDDDDRIEGGEDDDTINGDAGDDHIRGNDGFDSIDGGSDNDDIDGGRDDDSINGGLGDDRLRGGDGDDSLLGSGGDDDLDGGNDDDSVDGGSDNDEVSGGSGDDDVDGGIGDDRVRGGRGRDRISSGSGTDDVRDDDSDDDYYDDDSVDDDDDSVGGGDDDDEDGNDDDDDDSNPSGGPNAGAAELTFDENGNVSITGTSVNKNDRDIFKFTAAADGVLTVVSETTNGTFAKVEVEAAGDVEQEGETEPNDGINTFQLALVEGRTYFVKIKSPSNTPAAYVVNLSAGEGTIETGGGSDDAPAAPADVFDEVEPNDVKGTALAFAFPLANVVRITGTSVNSDDKDFFKFTAAANGTISAHVYTEDGQLANVEIESQFGADVLEIEQGDGQNSAQGQIVAGVTYFVRVRSETDGPAQYLLDLTIS